MRDSDVIHTPHPFCQGLATSVIREMDANSDGFISVEEFKAYYAKRRAAAAEEEE